MPLTILLRRVMQLTDGDAEAREVMTKLRRSCASWGKRQKEPGTVRLAWTLEDDPWRGTHAHAVLFAPHRLALDARRYLRKALLRITGRDKLPPFTLQFETRRGPVQPSQARGWSMYAAKQLIPQGETVADVRGAANPRRRPIQGRRVGLPRFAAIAAPVIAPAVTVSAQHPLRTTGRPVAAITEECFTMPSVTAPKRKRHRLEGFVCTEISACRVPVNRLCKIMVAKSADAPAALNLAQVDEDERWIFGVVAVSDVDGVPMFDDDLEHLPESEMVDAANSFLRSFGGGKRSHRGSSDAIRFTQSAILTAEVQKALGIELGYTPWIAGGFVEDDELWADIKAGTFRGFSVGGTAVRVLLEDDAAEPAQAVNKGRSAGGAKLFDTIMAERVAKARPRIAPKATPAAKRERCQDCPNAGRGSADPCRSGCKLEIASRRVSKSTAERGQEIAREVLAARFPKRPTASAPATVSKASAAPSSSAEPPAVRMAREAIRTLSHR